MSRRTYANLKIDELEKLFDEKRGNEDVLTSLLAELSCRNTPRAKSLKKRVIEVLSLGDGDSK
jgi:hypothetical protein